MFSIETERLVLRELTLLDIENLIPIFTDEATMVFYPATFSKEIIQSLLERQIASYKENKFGLWAVELKEGNPFIGDCGISVQDIDGQIVPEIGYHFNKKFWHNGYALEAAKACLAYGFEELKLDEIFIHASVKNIPSIKVAKRLSMTRRKVYPKFLKGYDVFWDVVVYSMVK